MSKRGRKKRKQKNSAASRTGRKLNVILDAVEFAAGADGFMRGTPEPVILFGAYGVSGERVVLLDRALRRIGVHAAYPTTTRLVAFEHRALFSAVIPGGFKRLLLLGIAVEDDSGDDVQAVYAELAAPGHLSAWLADDVVPEPLTLGELALRGPVAAPSAVRVQLLHHGSVWAEQCRHDEWVGAAYLATNLGERGRAYWRLRFATPDGRNDWTAKLQVRC